MQQFTKEGRYAIDDIAGRHQLSPEAVEHMLIAVNNGAGSMAQFNCPELGGSGQWMRGGMTMVGDMFNHNLKSRVDSLCNELSALLANTQVFPKESATDNKSNQWWPADLGTPHSSGSQNNSRYAVFSNRLVVESEGQVTVYDTLDHRINGTSQQQGSHATLTFSSQYGPVPIDSLPQVSAAGHSDVSKDNAVDADISSTESEQATDESEEIVTAADIVSAHVSAISGKSDAPDARTPRADGNPAEAVSDILSLIEKLAQLHSAGILSDEEFSAKKSELLARI